MEAAPLGSWGSESVQGARVDTCALNPELFFGRPDRVFSSASAEVSYDVHTLNHGWEADPNSWGVDLLNQDSWHCDPTPGIDIWEADWDSS